MVEELQHSGIANPSFQFMQTVSKTTKVPAFADLLDSHWNSVTVFGVVEWGQDVRLSRPVEMNTTSLLEEKRITCYRCVQKSWSLQTTT